MQHDWHRTSQMKEMSFTIRTV